VLFDVELLSLVVLLTTSVVFEGVPFFSLFASVELVLSFVFVVMFGREIVVSLLLELLLLLKPTLIRSLRLFLVGVLIDVTIGEIIVLGLLISETLEDVVTVEVEFPFSDDFSLEAFELEFGAAVLFDDKVSLLFDVEPVFADLLVLLDDFFYLKKMIY